ncbi:hypothetical protein C8F01DRAFT_1255941 [Mycena amicta]|nr:hypothetical protein C8F01DRAFT_1255941 [Mycena amicta]
MLDKDFVLTVKSAGLDAPRCIAELHPTDNTLAMGLTLVPRFKLPDVSRQEFVLLVDRSGSMGGKRIEAAKKALVVMLRAIPHKDSLFQIMSFGSRSSSLWPQGSKPRIMAERRFAPALSECFRARKTDRPLSVLMLTDGEAWDVDGVLAECKTAVEGAPKNAYIRISVLGIGNGVSTAMCEGIARIGNGTCMLVGEEEASFTGKISRMLKAAKSPPISDITCGLGMAFVDPTCGSPSRRTTKNLRWWKRQTEKTKEKKKLDIFDKSLDDEITADSTPAPPAPPVVLPPPPNLFPNVRLSIYAILQDKTIPKTSPLAICKTRPVPHQLYMRFAARKAIQDLEDGRHDVAKTLKNPDDSDLLARTVKAMIVRLGKTLFDCVDAYFLEALARLQAFDGCFSLDVLNVVKLAPSADIQAVRAALPTGVSDAVVATLLAMAFLANKLGADVERDAWEGMYEKAEEYVEGALQAIGATEKVEVLVGKVLKCLA